MNQYLFIIGLTFLALHVANRILASDTISIHLTYLGNFGLLISILLYQIEILKISQSYIEVVLGVCFLVTLFIGATIDKRFYILPDEGVYTLIILGLLRVFLENSDFFSLIALSIGSVIFFFLLWLFSFGGFGMGDIKWLVALTLWHTVGSYVVAVFLAFFLGAIYMGYKLWDGTAEKIIPFGPFIAIGNAISFLWSQSLIDLYWRLLVY